MQALNGNERDEDTRTISDSSRNGGKNSTDIETRNVQSKPSFNGIIVTSRNPERVLLRQVAPPAPETSTINTVATEDFESEEVISLAAVVPSHSQLAVAPRARTSLTGVFGGFRPRLYPLSSIHPSLLTSPSPAPVSRITNPIPPPQCHQLPPSYSIPRSVRSRSPGVVPAPTNAKASSSSVTTDDLNDAEGSRTKEKLRKDRASRVSKRAGPLRRYNRSNGQQWPPEGWMPIWGEVEQPRMWGTYRIPDEVPHEEVWDHLKANFNLPSKCVCEWLGCSSRTPSTMTRRHVECSHLGLKLKCVHCDTTRRSDNRGRAGHKEGCPHYTGPKQAGETKTSSPTREGSARVDSESEPEEDVPQVEERVSIASQETHVYTGPGRSRRQRSWGLLDGYDDDGNPSSDTDSGRE